jgi:hypothetical protein
MIILYRKKSRDSLKIHLNSHTFFSYLFKLIFFNSFNPSLTVPLTFFIVTALAIEKLGLTSFAWVLYAVVDRVWCRKIVSTIMPKKIILASEKGDIKDEKRKLDAQDDDDEEGRFVPSKVSFSVVTEIGKEEVDEEFRSASTTGTVVNPYIIKTATYSV